jgi:hypothetical protein
MGAFKKAHRKREWSDFDHHPLDEIARVALGIDELIAANPGRIEDECAPIVYAFELAFNFALQLGARIGSDPRHVPTVKDLLDEYRFVQSGGA